MKLQTLGAQLGLIMVVLVGTSQGAYAFWGGTKEPSPKEKCEQAGGVWSNGGCRNPYTGGTITPGGYSLPKCERICDN